MYNWLWVWADRTEIESQVERRGHKGLCKFASTKPRLVPSPLDLLKLSQYSWDTHLCTEKVLEISLASFPSLSPWPPCLCHYAYCRGWLMSSGWCQPAVILSSWLFSLPLLVDAFGGHEQVIQKILTCGIYSIYSFICLFPTPPFATHFLILSGSWPAMQPLPLLMISYGCLLFLFPHNMEYRALAFKVLALGRSSLATALQGQHWVCLSGPSFTFQWSIPDSSIGFFSHHLEQTLSYHETDHNKII